MTLSPRLEMALGKLYQCGFTTINLINPEYCTSVPLEYRVTNLEFWAKFHRSFMGLTQ